MTSPLGQRAFQDTALSCHLVSAIPKSGQLHALNVLSFHAALLRQGHPGCLCPRTLGGIRRADGLGSSPLLHLTTPLHFASITLGFLICIRKEAWPHLTGRCIRGSQNRAWHCHVQIFTISIMVLKTCMEIVFLYIRTSDFLIRGVRGWRFHALSNLTPPPTPQRLASEGEGRKPRRLGPG